MGRLIKEKHFLRISSVQKKSTYAWKSILYRRDLVCKGMRFIVDDGNLIIFGRIRGSSDHPPRPPRPRLQGDKLDEVN